MRLKQLLKDLGNYKIVNFKNHLINRITDFSENVKSGDLFVAIKGEKYDGHRFLNQVIKNKANVIVISDKKKDLVNKFSSYDGSIIIVDDTREFLVKLLSRFYKVFSNDLFVLGITGTNGKTTTCNLLYEILVSVGKKVGVFDTIKFNTGIRTGVSSLTTPDVFTLQSGLKEMKDAGCEIALIELSSHGIIQSRVDFSQFKMGILTNITQDHLDYHKTMKNYVAAKLKLFEHLNKEAFAVLNKDIKFFENFKKITKADVFTYGINKKADFKAIEIEKKISGSEFKLIYPSGKVNIKTTLIGTYNIYNILASLSAAYLLGLDIRDLTNTIENFKTVPGRLQLVEGSKKFKVFVDYAHTPDALENVLISLKTDASKKLILVFGCGGDRDKKKRLLMGKIASLYSDFFIITNDNPRSEEPEKIVNDIKQGIPKDKDNFSIITDRRKAICEAMKKAKEGDIVLIAGKGHEKYQILKNSKIFFSDVLEAKKILEKIKKS